MASSPASLSLDSDVRVEEQGVNFALQVIGRENVTLKEEQMQILKTVIVEKKDALAVLPAGFGKSLVYQLMAPFADFVESGFRPRTKTNSIVLVVSPLNALIRDRVETGSEIQVDCKMASSLVKQDLPPKGGYPPIEYARNLPKRGPSGLVMFISGAVVMAYGFYHVIMGNRRRCELMTEKMNARIGILPLLQAEHDRKCLRALKENEELEALIMKDVPGWKVGESCYHTDKWVTPMPAQVEKL